MNAKRTILTVILLLFTAVSAVSAQSGPSFSVTFTPGGSQQVGQDVDIYIQVNASTYGASKITPSCGGVSKTETSEIDYHSTWHTNGCQGGNVSIQVCSKTAADEQWQEANCQNFGYSLTGSAPASQPTGTFGADTGNLKPGQCTTMHWNISGTNSVDIDGTNYAPSGSKQICPSVTEKYSLQAAGPDGTMAYWNFEVTVSVISQPGNTGPTNSGTNSNPGSTSNNPPSNGAGSPSLPQARQSNVDGGVNLSIVCYNAGYTDGAVNVDNTADGWRCKQGNTYVPMDWNNICASVWGADSHPVKISNNIDGWRCLQGNNPVNSPTSNNNCGPTQNTIKLGDQATIVYGGSDGLNLRADAGLSQNIEGSVQGGTVVVVVGGPKCADNYMWWQVQTPSQGTWWVAEGNSSSFWLVPGVQQNPSVNQNPPPSGNGSCGPQPSRLSAGQIAIVSDFDPNPINVYSNPSKTSGETFQVAIRQQVSIVQGATCADGMTWVQIGYNGQVGWVVEVPPSGLYNLVPNGMPLPGPGGNGEIQPINPPVQQNPPSQPVQSQGCSTNFIQVDDTNSSGVVSGKTYGSSPCDAILEITNTRSYWVNIVVVPILGPDAWNSFVPVGGNLNWFATYNILPPNASVRYQVGFTRPNQAVNAFLDYQIDSGTAAPLMNTLQLLIDEVALEFPAIDVEEYESIATKYFPDIIQAAGPHLKNAARALWSHDTATFENELQQASDSGEFEALGNSLQDLGLNGAKDVFSEIFKPVGRVLTVGEIVVRNFETLYAQLFEAPAGNVIFRAMLVNN